MLMSHRHELVRQLAPGVLLARLPIDVVHLVVQYVYDLQFGAYTCRYFLIVD